MSALIHASLFSFPRLHAAHRLPHQVHPVLRDPGRAVRRQRADQAGKVPDAGDPPRDQPQAGDQTFETGQRGRCRREKGKPGHG